MSNSPISGMVRQPVGRPGAVEANVETLKNRYDWFVVASAMDGQNRVCTKEDVEQVFREDIMSGRLRAGRTVRVYLKKKGEWEESAPTLREFAQKYPKLQAVYEPVWNRAQVGALWGLRVGTAAAILNSLCYYVMTDRLVALCLAVAALCLFIPRTGPKIAPYVFGVLGLLGKISPAFGILVGVVLFTALGGVSGMAIGGAIGWIWEEKLPRAPDVPVEAHGVMESLVLPLAGSLVLWCGYVFFLYPWLIHMIGGPLNLGRTASLP